MKILAGKWKNGCFWLGWAILFGLIFKNMLVLEPSGLYAGWVNVWGDWAAHLSYTTSFAYGYNWPPQMPILAGERFSYPFLANFGSVLLIKLGLELIPAMLLSSWFWAVALVAALMILGKELAGSWRVGRLTSLLFLVNGGLGFWWWFTDIKKMGLTKVMSNLPRQYTHLDKMANIQWINIITSQVVPQRSFLMGFTIAIGVYYFLWQYWKYKQVKNLSRAGWITAMLPLIHAHSFVIIIWVAGWLLLIQWFRKSKTTLQLIKEWSRFFLPVILIGLPQVAYFYINSVTSNGFIRFKPGWMAYKGDDNIVWFWIKNLGLMLGLIVGGLKISNKKLRWFSLPFFGLFLAGNLWIFQPWEWDNTKIFTHWYLLASVLAAVAVEKGLKKKKLYLKISIVVVLFLSLLAGGLDVIRLTQYQNRKIRFFNNEQLEMAEWVKKNTDPKAVFLTASNHDHWLPTLTGRKIVLGFKGWLWTYGIDYSKQEKEVRDWFEGKEEMRTDYAVIGPAEKREFKINEEYFQNNYRLVYQQNKSKIYKKRDHQPED